MWRCRAERSRPGSTSAPVSAAMAPIEVRIARSSPRARTTVMPVGSPSRRGHGDTSTPRAATSSSTCEPKWSRPTAATSAVERPSRAAPQAVIEAEPPIVSTARSTSCSRWPNSGTGSPPTSSRSGLQSPTTSRSNAAGGGIYATISSSSSSRRRASPFRNARRALGVHADGLLPDRAAGDEPGRAARQRDPELADERLVVDPGREQRPGRPERIGERLAAGDVTRVLELEEAGAAGLGEERPVPDQVGAASGEGRGVLVVGPVDQHLDDEQQVGGGAVGGGRADQRGVRAVGVLAVGPQAHEELRRRPAQPADAGRPDIGQELRRPQPAGCGDAPLRSSDTRRPVRAGKRAAARARGGGRSRDRAARRARAGRAPGRGRA